MNTRSLLLRHCAGPRARLSHIRLGQQLGQHGRLESLGAPPNQEDPQAAQDEQVLRLRRYSLPARALLSQAFPVFVPLACRSTGAVLGLPRDCAFGRRWASDLGPADPSGLARASESADRLSALRPWTGFFDRCGDWILGDPDLASSFFHLPSSSGVSHEGRTAS